MYAWSVVLNGSKIGSGEGGTVVGGSVGEQAEQAADTKARPMAARNGRLSIDLRGRKPRTARSALAAASVTRRFRGACDAHFRRSAIAFLIAATVLAARISTILRPHSRFFALSASDTPSIVAFPALTRCAHRIEFGSVMNMLSAMPGSS